MCTGLTGAFPNPVFQPLNPYAGASTPGDALATGANTGTSALCVPVATRPKNVVLPKSPEQRRAARTEKWKRPKWTRGYIWSAHSPSKLPSADATEYADPFPSVPDSVLRDSQALHTIATHPHLFAIVTPINVDRFELLLSSHPNRPLIRSVCKGLRDGVWPFALPDENSPCTFDFSSRALQEDASLFVREQ